MGTSAKRNAAGVPRLLILGIHELDWNLISEKLLNGTLPHLATCVSQGVSGPLHSVYPLNSGSEWTSLATGKRAFRHRILSSGTVMQPAELPVSDREGPALWNILSQANIGCGVIGWPGITKAEDIQGLMVAPSFFEANEFPAKKWPVPEGSVAPAIKAKDFSALRLHPNDVPESWCETFLPAYFKEEPEVAAHLSTIRSALAVDRSKLNLAIDWAKKEEWTVLGVCLSGLGEISHIGMPYHSTSGAREPLYQSEIFGGLVDRVYEWYDVWIHELFNALPTDTNVLIVSDHGALTHSRHRRSSEGDRGCLIASGPAFAKQIPIRRATLLDICPTVLSIYGIRQERDTDGTILQNILASPKPLERIVNWQRALVEVTTPRRDINSLQLQELYRLGIAFLDAGQLVQAVDSLHRAWEKMPSSPEIAAALASALLLSGHRQHVATVLQMTSEQLKNSSSTSLVDGSVGFRFDWHQEKLATPLPLQETFSAVAQWLKNLDEVSVDQLFELFRATPESFLLSLICGFAASSLGRWKDAQIFLSRASSLNSSDPESLVEISRIHLHLGKPQAALKSVRLAIERAPLHLRGRIVLAEALLASGQITEAAEEAKKATRFIEQRRPALLILARASKKQKDVRAASRYRKLACRTKRKLAAIGESFGAFLATTDTQTQTSIPASKPAFSWATRS